MVAVPTAARSINEYRECVGHEPIEDIVRLAKPLRGSRILQLSAVPSRAELSGTLSTLTSLLQDLGLEAEWRIVRLKSQQIIANQTLSRALNGHFVRWTTELSDLWLGHDDDLDGISPQDYDFVVVHDAGAAGTIAGASCLERGGRARWVWHCHSDVSRTQPDVWHFLMRHSLQYDKRIISSLKQSSTSAYHPYSTVPQTIDPLSLRNRELPQRFVDMILRHYGLDTRHPLILCSSRNGQDARDVLRLTEGFRLAKEQMPRLQLLALVADDVDGCSPAQTERQCEDSSDMRLLPMPRGIGNLGINAFQRAAAVVVESSRGEELSPSLLEAMWKERPVIVGGATAAELGIEHGVNGFVAHTAKDLGNQIVRLVESRLTAKTISLAAREHVRRNYLITRLLRAYLTLMRELVNPQSMAAPCLAAAR